jgi:hypothetical protein
MHGPLNVEFKFSSHMFFCMLVTFIVALVFVTQGLLAVGERDSVYVTRGSDSRRCGS